MDNVKKLLARYVEWIAVALGGAFLLWMVYLYVLTPPVTVAVGPSPAVTPGDIDSQIWNGPGIKLQTQMADTAVVKVPVPTFAAEVQADVGVQTPDVLALLPAPYVQDAPVVPVGPGKVEVVGPTPAVASNAVTELPKVAALYGLQVAQGKSTVVPPAAAAGGGTLQPMDKSWVTILANVPSQTQLKAAFAAAKLPVTGNIGATTVLAVRLVREEVLPDGTFGPEQVIAPPAMDALEPMPAAKVENLNAATAQIGYLTYARDNAQLVCRPAFYQVVQGDAWYLPGTKNPNVTDMEMVLEKFDPAHPPTDRPLTPEEQEEVRKYKQKKAADDAAAAAARRNAARGGSRGGPRAGGPGAGGRGGGGGGGTQGGGGGGGPGGGFLIEDPDRESVAAGPGISGGFGTAPRSIDANGGESRPVVPVAPPVAPPAASAQAAAAPELPKAPFFPAVTPDFVVWAHDDTVMPGKSYRYQMRYSIANPVFDTLNQCKPQSLALTFSLDGQPSEWTDAVKVESDTNFYAVASQRGTVQFDMFNWKNGAWQMQSVTLSPGDQLPTTSSDGAGGAGWTLVDVRDATQDSSNKIVLLASDNGTLEKQTGVDSKLRKYHALKDAASGKVKPGGAPGTPPMPAMPGGAPQPPGRGNEQDTGNRGEG